MKGVQEHARVDLVAQEEVTRHRDTPERDAGAAPHLDRQDCECDREAETPLQHLIEVGVVGVVVIVQIACKAQFFKEEFVQQTQLDCNRYK